LKTFHPELEKRIIVSLRPFIEKSSIYLFILHVLCHLALIAGFLSIKRILNDSSFIDKVL